MIAPQSTQAALGIATHWKLDRLLLGTLVDQDNVLGSLLMPDVIKFPDGTYRMYFNQSKGPGKDVIAWASSPDGRTWTYEGSLLKGSQKKLHRFYILGGARVVKLKKNVYRMYFRAAPAELPNQRPAYKVYSAISKDNGEHFKIESGIRVNIAPDDPSSPFTLAGHGTFFKDKQRHWTAIISADSNPYRNKPSDLYIGHSSDGLEWHDWSLLYENFHDPDVVRYQGVYYIVATLMDQATYVGTSLDGNTWTAQAELTTLQFENKKGKDVSAAIGDVGLFVMPNGKLRILSNWSAKLKPGATSTAIAGFKPN